MKSRKVFPITDVDKKKKIMQGNNSVPLTERRERRKETEDSFQCFRHAHPHVISKPFLKREKYKRKEKGEKKILAI